MSRLHQIYEDDLAELERSIPLIMLAIEAAPPKVRMKLRRVKEILSDVRWDYGPHLAAGTIARDGA